MIRPNQIFSLKLPKPVPARLRRLRPEVARVLTRFSTRIEGVEADSDAHGYLRQLTCSDAKGLGKGLRFAGSPLRHARRVLAMRELKAMLKLSGVELRHLDVNELPGLGWEVSFQQVLRLKRRRRRVIARGGVVQVFMKQDGCVYEVQSTLRHGTPSRELNHVTPGRLKRLRVLAVEAALKEAEVKKKQCVHIKSTYMASLHKGKFDPCFSVHVITCGANSFNREYLVKVSGQKAQVVYHYDRRHYLRGVRSRCFHTVPTYGQPIPPQVRDHVLESLPDRRQLRNAWVIMKVLKEGNWQDVTANENGNFKFAPDTSEFSAVNVFVWLTAQFERHASLGARRPAKPIAVFIDDPDVPDNAYDDRDATGLEHHGEIHMGVGSGIGNGGLAEKESYDGGVPSHEGGHQEIAWNAPDGNLEGSEGRAAHEGWAGDANDLSNEAWFLLNFGKEYGIDFNQQWLKDNRSLFFIIGKYVLAPAGIRNEFNSKQYPGDLAGEEHEDGLIIGGAWGDLLYAMLTAPDVDMASELDAYRKLRIRGVQHMPHHKVLFRDILRQAITVDQVEFHGKYRALIEKAHADHGVSLSTLVTDPDALRDDGLRPPVAGMKLPPLPIKRKKVR